MTDPPAPPSATVLTLLELPFVFSQVGLLNSRSFLDEAKKWGYRLTLNDLQELNRLRLVVPLYRADDEALPAAVAAPHAADHSKIARYAREGMIRDPHTDEDPALFPHLRPADAPDRWWDGYFYSKWQLLGLGTAMNALALFRERPATLPGAAEYATKLRNEHVALAALSARSFPQIVGQLTLSDGADRENLTAARYGTDVETRLAASAFPAEQLRPVAEYLLRRASNDDPMSEWWDLIRHSNHSGWFRMRGSALEAVWQRLAAEVLLRAHEELAEDGKLAPLPEPALPPAFWDPLMDRVGAQPYAEGLERSLARVSLAPNPRVLLVVEGETELLHVSAMLEELGIGRPHQVRLDKQGTSSDWPNQLARYVAPRLGRVRGGRHDVEFGPTALVVAMDAEGTRWGTAHARERHLKKLQAIVHAEVRAQGGSLTQDELDILVQVRTWGEQKYEFANFADAELETAMLAIAPQISPGPATDDTTREALRGALSEARRRKRDIDVVFRQMRWKIEKVSLAQELLPILLAKLNHDEIDDPAHEHPPVVELMYDVYDLVQKLSGSAFQLESPVPNPPAE